jgi:alkanesulfonate monooxygenase SsuD/methylene tetrahydromethanopterin reductase-like flavin-dependent oxidoreductase (luciferase family)
LSNDSFSVVTSWFRSPIKNKNSRPDPSLPLYDRGVIIAGDPDSCIKGVQLYEHIGVDQVILIVQTETIPHERVLQSIELFGKHVLPAFGKGVKKAQPATAAR